MPSTTADRHDPRPANGRGDRADPVAAEDSEAGHGRCDVEGQIGLPPADGSEVEAAGTVDQDGHVEVALLDRIADVRFTRPREDRPIHAADVIARLVRSRVSGLDSVAEHQREMTTVPAAEDLPAHRELDAAEAGRQVETGALCGAHVAAGGSPGSTMGGGPSGAAYADTACVVGATAPSGPGAGDVARI